MQKMYTELAVWWPLISPPVEYQEEPTEPQKRGEPQLRVAEVCELRKPDKDGSDQTVEPDREGDVQGLHGEYLNRIRAI